MRGGSKFPEDDFYCWRYQVWYNSLDCAGRTLFRTSPGCRDCPQGERNLALNRERVARVRWPRLTAGFADAADRDPAEEPAVAALPAGS